MSATRVGIGLCFDHNLQQWKNYKNRINQWFIANDIDVKNDSTGNKRRAILLSALNDNTYSLVADLALPKDLTEVPFEDILLLLDKLFTPKLCGFGERYTFYSATQQSNETYSEFAARLRGLTAHCDFINVEEALRDRFVMGISSGYVKDKLFTQEMKELTLEKAVSLAISIQLYLRCEWRRRKVELQHV